HPAVGVADAEVVGVGDVGHRLVGRAVAVFPEVLGSAIAGDALEGGGLAVDDRVRHRRVGAHERHGDRLDVAGVADAVAVDVGLVRVAHVGAVVDAGALAVAVGILVGGLGLARVAHVVAVAVTLRGIGHVDAVVAEVAERIVVGVGLIGV